MDTIVIRAPLLSSYLTPSPFSLPSKFPRTLISIGIPLKNAPNQRNLNYKIPSNSKLYNSQKNNAEIFNEAAFESNRLTLDAKARESMAEASEREMRESEGKEVDPKAWKWRIRKRVWDLMEAQNIAQFPRPVHNRIPNFVGATLAANKVFSLMLNGLISFFLKIYFL